MNARNASERFAVYALAAASVASVAESFGSPKVARAARLVRWTAGPASVVALLSSLHPPRVLP